MNRSSNNGSVVIQKKHIVIAAAVVLLLIAGGLVVGLNWQNWFGDDPSCISLLFWICTTVIWSATPFPTGRYWAW